MISVIADRGNNFVSVDGDTSTLACEWVSAARSIYTEMHKEDPERAQLFRQILTNLVADDSVWKAALERIEIVRSANVSPPQ